MIQSTLDIYRYLKTRGRAYDACRLKCHQHSSYIRSAKHKSYTNQHRVTPNAHSQSQTCLFNDEAKESIIDRLMIVPMVMCSILIMQILQQHRSFSNCIATIET